MSDNLNDKMLKNIGQMKLLYTLFDDMGSLIRHIGETEKSTNQGDFLKSFSKNSLAMMNDLAESLTSEELEKFMKLLIKLAKHASNLTNFLELSSDDKIIVGNEIKKLAKDAEYLISSMEERNSQ